MKATRKLTPAQAFFFVNAGWSYMAGKESKSLGRTRCAVELAAAEDVYIAAHRVADVSCDWEHDSDAAQDGEHDETCEYACIRIDGQVVASLGAICDASDEYRRVVRAELASECLEQLRAAATAVPA